MRLDPPHAHLRQAWSPSSRVRAKDLFDFVQRAQDLLGPETTTSVLVTDNHTFEIRAERLDDLRNTGRSRNAAGSLTAEVVVEAPMGGIRIDIGARRGLGRFFTKATARHVEKLVAEELIDLGSVLVSRHANLRASQATALGFCALILAIQFARLMLTPGVDLESPDTAQLQIAFLVNLVLTWLLSRGAVSRITIPMSLRPKSERWEPSTVAVNRATVIGVVIAIVALLASIAALIPAYIALLQS